MDITFPMKGLNTNAPRNTMPADTSPSLLNVVPFDRDYRQRGSIRPGSSKYSTNQLGNGGQPVLLVEQVTTALDPTTVVPSTNLLNEGFNYSAGHLAAVSSGVWLDRKGSQGINNSVTDATDVTAGNKVTTGNVTFADSSCAYYTPTLVLGAAYIIRATVVLNASGIHGPILYSGIDVNTPSSQTGIVKLRVSLTEMELNDGGNNSLNIFTFGTALTAGTTHTLELHVSGTIYTGFLDGLQFVTYTRPTIPTTTGIGLGFWYNATGDTIDDLNVFAATPLAVFRQTTVVASCGGNIYLGTAATGIAIASGGSSVLSQTIKPQMASKGGLCYFVDSQNPLKQLNLSNKTVTTLAVSTGSETATTLGKNTLATVWRDRLVLAAQPSNPQNFFMSRQGDPTDWDYSQTDPAAAVAGNAAKAGAIGEPLNALIPWTDDVLILGGDHSIYKVEGDIAAGGQILLVTDSVGTLGPDCWDSDPNGNVYFAGSGGLYQMSPNALPQNIANEDVRNFFSNIDRTTHYVCLTWDRDRNGLYIHVTPVNTGPAIHLFWDSTTGGFFPIQYPDVFGPMTAISFDGDGPTDRQILFGTRDGYIRTVDPSSLTDDGTAISSYVYLGPFRPAGDAALSVLEAVEVMLGDAPVGFTESDFQVGLSVIVAKDAYAALNSPDKIVAFSFVKQSRRKRLLQRISGGTFFFKLTGVTGKLWSMEKLVALFTEGGLQRRY